MKNPRILAASISAALLALPTAASAQTWAGTTTGTTAAWNVDANWASPANFPNSTDAIANVTADWSAAKSITLNQAITVGTLNMEDTGAPTDSIVSITTGTGTNALTFDVTSGNASFIANGANHTVSANITLADTLEISGAGGTPVLSGNIGETGGAKGLIKLAAAGNLTLSGNSTFSGGIIHRQATINISGASNGNLGTGTFTWANLAGGSNNTLTLNTNVSKTLANNFVNDNAAVVTGTQYAQFSYSGGTTSYRTTTFDGSFSTGPNYLPASGGLFLGANGTQTALAEGALILNGDWSGYLGGDANSTSLRINSGSVVINAQQAVAGSGIYSISGNDFSAASKLVLSGAFTNAREVRFSGSLGGQRNSYGARNAAATTATHSGPIQTLDAKGGNLFSQNSGAILEVTGLLQGSTNLRINDAYTFTTGDSANSLQTPAGTVVLSRATGGTATGGVTVVGGTLLVSNTSGSATGTGAVVVGAISGTVSGMSGTGAATSRVITGVNTAAAIAAGFEVGQTITGTGIPGGSSIITGIAIGTAAADTEITIAGTITGAVSFTDLATTTFTKTGTLGGTGRIAPTGANGLSVLSGSAIALVDGAAADLDFDFVGTGSASFASGALFKMELGAPGVSDVIDFAGLADASTVAFNGNVIDFTNLGGLAEGTYTLFTFDTASDYTGTLAIGAGLEAFPGSSFAYNATDIQLVVIPEPSAALSVLGGVGLLLGLRRRRCA